MRRASVVAIGVLLVFSLPAVMIVGEQAGDVAFSSDSIALSSTNPVEGDDLEITLTLTNSASIQATNVHVTLHPDDLANTAFFDQTVSIDGDGFIQLQAMWTNVPFGAHSVVMEVTHGGSSGNVSKSFTASGLADLVVNSVTLNPTADLHGGDVIDVSVIVSNIGNALAQSTHLLLAVDGTTLTELQVPALPTSQSATINTSFNAPPAGEHQLVATANSQSSDGVTESDSANNVGQTATFTVLSDPDYHHHQQPDPTITVTTPQDALAGPWTLSGEILRMGGSGESTISVAIYLTDGGQEVIIRTFDLTFTESNPLQPWQEEISTDDLQVSTAGDHHLLVRIDPSRQVPQSIPFNDELATIVTIYQEPNVVVSPFAAVSSDSVMPGEQVMFNVTVTNVGILPTFGSLFATFDGNSLSPIQAIGLPAGEERTFTFQAATQGEANRVLAFSASWVASEGSYDSVLSDNTATGQVTLQSSLRLRFLQDSEAWTPDDSPLQFGKTYTYTIVVQADDGAGQETFTCLDKLENVPLGEMSVSFSGSGETATVMCTFTTDRSGTFILYVQPSGDTVATWTTSWMISTNTNEQESQTEVSMDQAKILLILAAIALIGVLVLAIYLTRDQEADAERETFEYCPSCDGEIEGDEEICPHCEFDLAEGRSQFHECAGCGSTVPDLMEHCPYCGETQDVSSFYERRERKVVETIEEFDVEEEEDWDEIVQGHEGFDDTLEELGFDEQQYESEWDSSLGEVEQELDEIIEQREQEVELTDDQAEAEFAETQLRTAFESEQVDIDQIIGDKEKRRHLKDDDVQLTASDQDIRSDIYRLTGEEGVLPGEKVDVDYIPDHTVVGNVLKEADEVTDFTVDEKGDQVPKRSSRKTPKRRKNNDDDDSA